MLIANAEGIKEAADLSQIFLLIGDKYEMSVKHGMLTVPWNFAVDDVPTRMKELLGGTSAARQTQQRQPKPAGATAASSDGSNEPLQQAQPKPGGAEATPFGE